MARQDFAQVKSTTQSKSGSGFAAAMSAVGIVMIAVLCFGGGYWLGSSNEDQAGGSAGIHADVAAVEAKLAAQVAENKLLQARNEALQDSVGQWKQKAQQDAHSKLGDLSFYKELPKQSVTPAPMPDTPAATANPRPEVKAAVSEQSVASVIAKSSGLESHAPDSVKQEKVQGGYRIQLASFRARSDAMVMQGKLAKAGFRALVHQVDLGEKGQWYRIYAGPYHSRAVAEADQKKIEKKIKLKGFLVRGG